MRMNPAEPFVFRRADPSDAADVLALYKSLLGRPYCPWDDSYPAMEHVLDDLSAHALYGLSDRGELIAAGTVRRWPEHDGVAAWRGANPCDLMRLGVSGSRQGQGIGAAFLNGLLKAALGRGFDSMRILVAENNLPARTLYRNAGAEERGTCFAYEIHWICCELNLEKMTKLADSACFSEFRV